MKIGSTNETTLNTFKPARPSGQGMKDYIQAFNEKQVLKAIEKNKSMKHARCKQCTGQKQLILIRDEDGTLIHNRDCIVTHCVKFYQVLYKSRRLQTNTMEPQNPHRPSMDDAPSIILPTEVEALIKKLDHSKASGNDNITGGVLQDGGEPIVNLLTQLLSKCLQLCQVPKARQNALMILLHKKGNTSDIKNYRPISLLPIIYKVFTCILLQWIL